MANLKLKNNLANSKQACSYILSAVKMIGANWDQYARTGRSYEDCVQKLALQRITDRKACQPYKDSVDICVYDKTRPIVKRIAKGKSMSEYLRTMAAVAVKNKCGNCAEFSAAAFVHMLDKKVLPLDWCGLKGADHAFVIVGRASGDINDFDTWGGAAAICDPWAQGFRKDPSSGTYPGVNFKKQMGGLLTFLGVEVLHRVE